MKIKLFLDSFPSLSIGMMIPCSFLSREIFLLAINIYGLLTQYQLIAMLGDQPLLDGGLFFIT